jgi:hypothetical protein
MSSVDPLPEKKASNVKIRGKFYSEHDMSERIENRFLLYFIAVKRQKKLSKLID